MDTARWKLEVKQVDGQHVVVVEGELDAHTAPELAAALDGLDPADLPIVLDLAGVDFVDSSGLGAIVNCHNSRDESAPLVLRGLNERVAKVVEYAGLAGHLTIEP